MKIIVNRCYGGFGISDEAKKMLKLKDDYNYILRLNPVLIALIEEKGSDFCSGHLSELEVVEIPEEATDYEVVEYDGLEHIVCVVNGKLRHIF